MKDDGLLTSAELGARVRELRKSQGVTQAQLAGLANTGVRFVSDLENGKETCHLGKTLRVLSTLGVVVYIRSPYDKE